MDQKQRLANAESEAVDTTTSAGRMMMQMLGSFAEFERSMVRERTRAGLAAARDRGVKVGRPAKLMRALGGCRITVYRHFVAHLKSMRSAVDLGLP